MSLKSALFAAVALAAAPIGAIAQSGMDEALAQTSATAPAGTTTGTTGVGTTGTTFPKTPPATTAPYQFGTAPSYSSWPPPATSSPGYRSTQPTYQTNSPLVTTPTTAGSSTTPGAASNCVPTSSVGVSPTAGTATGTTCP